MVVFRHIYRRVVSHVLERFAEAARIIRIIRQLNNQHNCNPLGCSLQTTGNHMY